MSVYFASLISLQYNIIPYSNEITNFIDSILSLLNNSQIQKHLDLTTLSYPFPSFLLKSHA